MLLPLRDTSNERLSLPAFIPISLQNEGRYTNSKPINQAQPIKQAQADQPSPSRSSKPKPFSQAQTESVSLFPSARGATQVSPERKLWVSKAKPYERRRCGTRFTTQTYPRHAPQQPVRFVLHFFLDNRYRISYSPNCINSRPSGSHPAAFLL